MFKRWRIGFSQVLKLQLDHALSFLPRKPTEPQIGSGTVFAPAAAPPAPVRNTAPPLPPCKPLNLTEQTEAATLVQLRGALYPKAS